MTIRRSSAFTATNGLDWPLIGGGAWSHIYENGTLNSQNVTVQSNQGYVAGWTGVENTVFRHHADINHSILNAEARIKFIRNNLNIEPGIFMRANSSAAGSDMYLAQCHTVVGDKATSYGLAVFRRVNGSWVRLHMINVLGIDTKLSGNIWNLAMRTITVSGFCYIQAKIWESVVAEPAWLPVTGNANRSSGSGTNAVSITIIETAANTINRLNPGQVGLYTDFVTASTSMAVWYDDFSILSLGEAALPLGGMIVNASGIVTPGVSNFPANFGASPVDSMYVGNTPASKLYLGPTQLWP